VTWKPLAEMQGKAAYIRPKVAGPFPVQAGATCTELPFYFLLWPRYVIISLLGFSSCFSGWLCVTWSYYYFKKVLSPTNYTFSLHVGFSHLVHASPVGCVTWSYY
jgi:hypothetical protein